MVQAKVEYTNKKEKATKREEEEFALILKYIFIALLLYMAILVVIALLHTFNVHILTLNILVLFVNAALVLSLPTDLSTLLLAFFLYYCGNGLLTIECRCRMLRTNKGGHRCSFRGMQTRSGVNGVSESVQGSCAGRLSVGG